MFDDYDMFPVYPQPEDDEEGYVEAKPQYIYVAPKAHRVQDLRPIMPGSVIGYTVTLCSHCHGRIDINGIRDNYCKHCGHRLEVPKDD